jgi:hypothetical protein
LRRTLIDAGKASTGPHDTLPPPTCFGAEAPLDGALLVENALLDRGCLYKTAHPGPIGHHRSRPSQRVVTDKDCGVKIGRITAAGARAPKRRRTTDFVRRSNNLAVRLGRTSTIPANTEPPGICPCFSDSGSPCTMKRGDHAKSNAKTEGSRSHWPSNTPWMRHRFSSPAPTPLIFYAATAGRSCCTPRTIKCMAPLSAAHNAARATRPSTKKWCLDLPKVPAITKKRTHFFASSTAAPGERDATVFSR